MPRSAAAALLLCVLRIWQVHSILARLAIAAEAARRGADIVVLADTRHQYTHGLRWLSIGAYRCLVLGHIGRRVGPRGSTGLCLLLRRRKFRKAHLVIVGLPPSPLRDRVICVRLKVDTAFDVTIAPLYSRPPLGALCGKRPPRCCIGCRLDTLSIPAAPHQSFVLMLMYWARPEEWPPHGTASAIIPNGQRSHRWSSRTAGQAHVGHILFQRLLNQD